MSSAVGCRGSKLITTIVSGLFFVRTKAYNCSRHWCVRPVTSIFCLQLILFGLGEGAKCSYPEGFFAKYLKNGLADLQATL